MGQARRREGEPPKGDGYKENQVTRFEVDYAKDSTGRRMIANPSHRFKTGRKVFRTGPKLKVPKKR